MLDLGRGRGGQGRIEGPGVGGLYHRRNRAPGVRHGGRLGVFSGGWTQAAGIRGPHGGGRIQAGRGRGPEPEDEWGTDSDGAGTGVWRKGQTLAPFR